MQQPKRHVEIRMSLIVRSQPQRPITSAGSCLTSRTNAESSSPAAWLTLKPHSQAAVTGDQRIGAVLVLQNSDPSADDLYIGGASPGAGKLADARVKVPEDVDVLKHAVLSSRHGERRLCEIVAHVDRERTHPSISGLDGRWRIFGRP